MKSQLLNALLLATVCTCNLSTAWAGVRGGQFAGTVDVVLGGVPDGPEELQMSVSFDADGGSVWTFDDPNFPEPIVVSPETFQETDFLLFSIWSCQLNEWTQASGFSFLFFVTTVQVENDLDWGYHMDGILRRSGSYSPWR